MSTKVVMWIAFNLIVFTLLYVDLAVLNKRAHEVSIKEALLWCTGWVSIAMLFCLGIYFKLGQEMALKFLTGYVIEYSLSMDNMFVFVLIFSYFGVPRKYQPRILHWGILGAVVMRFILIFTGVTLIHMFHWLIYVFGGLLIATAIRMAFHDGEQIHPDKNLILKFFKKIMPFDHEYSDGKFFTRKNKIWHATPLFATLLVIEASDLVFAVDSIPAILAISKSYFIVYTSNVFAILGLRALYFLLSGVMGLFRFLKYGISVILLFVGIKMSISAYYTISITLSLGVVIGILIFSILLSILIKPKKALD
ncbi:MAG TPA: TerC family protein [Elusimicrobiales bacterium]|nr:TerC family protein [Elusimicrobiales bacterium]